LRKQTMPLITWNDSYSVKIREIDRQHLKLVQIINDLNDAMQEGKANDVLAKILRELVSYTKTHFTAEEKYLEQYGYPDVSAHKRKHSDFVEKISELRDNFASGRLGVSIETMKFLMDWLLQHIKGADMKYAPFLAGKGVS
ncbi:MAG: bacteriohemerythrin, partial [Azonexus sp.]